LPPLQGENCRNIVVAAGHTPAGGAFRGHVARLVEFLQSAAGLTVEERGLANRAIDAVTRGSAPAGKWLELAGRPEAPWKEIGKRLGKG